MIEIVSDIVKALNKITPKENELLHHTVCDAIEESSSVWRKDYTIAVAKDESKTKVANLMVSNTLNEEAQTFKVKREHDFWKKLESRDDYKAVVEFSFFPHDLDICTVESIGRNIMRARKEVPTVASLGFVWVVHVDNNINIDSLFQLYFKEDFIILKQEEAKYYIGWSDMLKQIDMRNFICDPSVKKTENEIVEFSTEVEPDEEMMKD